jgi:hypothetical protein
VSQRDDCNITGDIGGEAHGPIGVERLDEAMNQVKTLHEQ